MAYDLGTAHGTIEIDYDGQRAVNRAERDMERLKTKSKDTDKEFKKLKATFKNLGKGAGYTLLATGATQAAIGAANLGVQLLGMIPSLASIASLSAGLPAAFVGAAAAGGVLKASFAGVDKAVAAALDPAKADQFDKAIENLSPSAQAFAKALKGSSKELQGFQQGLQEAFFKTGNFAGLVPKVVSSLKTLNPSLQGIATDFARMGRQIADFALSQDTISFVSDSLVTFRQALNDASPAITPILTGLRDVGTVGRTLLGQLGVQVGNVGTKFGEWLSAIASDGRLQSWIDQAISTLKTLGNIATNIGGILKTVSQTAGETGGGLLQTIEKITGEFNTFLSSAEGKAAITSLFTGISAAASALSPVLSTVAGVLASALGPQLARLAAELGPQLIAAVEALAPAVGPLATAFVDLVTAVSPILPPLAQLVAMLVQLGSGVISTIAANLAPVVEVLASGLGGALTALAPALDQIIGQLPQLATAGLQIAQALAPLVPAVVQFATALTAALLPYLPQLIDAFLQLVPPMVQIATIMSGQLAGALTAIIPYLPQIIGLLVGMQTTMLTMVQSGLQFFAFLLQIGAALKALPGVITGAISAFAGAIVGGFQTAWSTVTSVGGQILGWFTSLPGKIGSFLASLPGVIGGVISNAVHEMAFRFGQGIGIVISQAIAFPGKVRAAAAALPGLLRGLAVSAWNAVKAAFSSGVAGAANFARTLPGRARSAISSLTGLLSGVARAAWNALRGAFSSGVGQAAGVASSLPGRIRSAVGNLGGLLVSAGRDAVMGLVNGIRGAIGAAVSAAASVGQSVINGIKSKLKISSPSRVMIAIGRFVTQGLRNGLLGTAKQVQSAANRLANMVRDAFSDRLIKKSQRNSVLKTLSTGTRKLITLVNRANTVAAKLKVAQKNLADAQKLYNDQYNNAVKQTRESFQLVTNGQEFVNLDLTKQRFKEAVAQAKQFAKDIATLTKRGLSKDLIAQLAAAGADGGGAMARALAGADAKTIKEFNSLQSQLNGAAKSVGKTTADALYGAGVNAAKGIVAGLKSQQKAIEKQMNAIANSMVKHIKKALKIKSPSRIMFQLGKFTAEGLKLGLEALRRQVQQAAQKLATASIIPTVRLTAASATPAVPAGFNPGGGGNVTTNVLNQTVNALPGMNAKQVADYSFTKLRLGLTTGVSAAPIPAPSPAGV